ncbi:hypothetical protein [Streptomyces sp. NPDC058268]|uniref:hypothetical protein n=1 Tax=Streptomyces sp. NPDC058268 TaxID=3346413 RepID=UPI0036E7A2D2
MTESLDSILARLDAYLRAHDNYTERNAALDDVSHRLDNWRHAHRQEVALGLRAEGKKWKEVGQIMGGVTYQRAFQIAHGD